MQLNLDKDLCVFDIESTGSDVVNDRIIQIAFIKYPKEGGAPIEKMYMVKPNHPIKPDATRVHGLTNEMLKDSPTFKELALEIQDFIGDADLAGYNSNRFDVPLLIEEFARVGLDFDMTGRRLIDALLIFYKMEPRTLKAALKFYCNKELKEAHDALADTRATADVILGQIKYYDGVDYVDNDDNVTPAPISNDIQAIHDFVNDGKRVDFMGRFVRDREGNIIFNFGKNKGELAHRHPNMLNWIISKDFPLQVKNIAKAILKGELK